MNIDELNLNTKPRSSNSGVRCKWLTLTSARGSIVRWSTGWDKILTPPPFHHKQPLQRSTRWTNRRSWWTWNKMTHWFKYWFCSSNNGFVNAWKLYKCNLLLGTLCRVECLLINTHCNQKTLYENVEWSSREEGRIYLPSWLKKCVLTILLRAVMMSEKMTSRIFSGEIIDIVSVYNPVT